MFSPSKLHSRSPPRPSTCRCSLVTFILILVIVGLFTYVLILSSNTSTNSPTYLTRYWATNNGGTSSPQQTIADLIEIIDIHEKQLQKLMKDHNLDPVTLQAVPGTAAVATTSATPCPTCPTCSNSASSTQLSLPSYTYTPPANNMAAYLDSLYPPVGDDVGSVLTGSWSVPPIRPACQKDADLLYRYIHKNQFVNDCKTRRLYVRTHASSYGWFAGLDFSTNFLFYNVLVNRTYIDLHQNNYLRGQCESNGYSCIFEPTTNCGRDDFKQDEICYDKSCWETARVISFDRILYENFPCAPTELAEKMCSNSHAGTVVTTSIHKLIPQLGPMGEQALSQEFLRFITKPNKKMKEYTVKMMEQLKISNQMLAVHIRHGDKQEGIQYPTEGYANALRRMIQVTGIRHVFIASDDPPVFTTLPKFVDLPNIEYTFVDPNSVPIVFAAYHLRDAKHTEIGISLTAQAYIMALARGYIGTRSSNVGQVVFTMQGFDCSRPKIQYDMGADLFYNSWYCRGDIKHAGREMLCNFKKPTDGSNLWLWGGADTEHC